MGYYQRLGEIASQRYEQEVGRSQQAGEQRTFYFGLLGGLAAAIAAVVQDHGLGWNGTAIDAGFWACVFVSTTGIVFTFIQLVLAICPQRVGYWALPRTLREYADGCEAHFKASGREDVDAEVIEKIDRAHVSYVEQVTEHNHIRNNLRNARTTRCFYGLVLTSPFVMGTFILSLLGAAAPADTGESNVAETQPPPSSPAPQPAPSSSAPSNVPSLPPIPTGVFIIEGSKSLSTPPPPPPPLSPPATSQGSG